MMWLLMWLNRSIATINVTLQLLDIVLGGGGEAKSISLVGPSPRGM